MQQSQEHTPPTGTRLLINRLIRIRTLIALLFLLYLSTAAWHVYKPQPAGLDFRSQVRQVADTELLVDATWINLDGSQSQSTEIFERMLELIARAKRLIVLEVFLLNDFAGAAGSDHRPLSAEVVDAMIARKQQLPSMPVVLIVDPFNRLYGGVESSLLDRAEAAGVDVIETDLAVLRDSNPIWSGFWRLCCQFLGNSTQGWLPNPVGGSDVSLRTYLNLLNFKANHRKAMVVDEDGHWTGIVTTGNPHDASSRHSNLAIEFSGLAALDLLTTMQATAELSGTASQWLPDMSTKLAPERPSQDMDSAHAVILTERAILEEILTILDDSTGGDRLDLALFYLSHREVIHAIAQAHARGVGVRLLLDPNEDAFGRKKDGVPNRQVALELHELGVPIRWCNTRGEQCHYKHLLHIGKGGKATVLTGSANFTRRNLDGFNLETQIMIESNVSDPFILETEAFFDARWQNQDDRLHSLPYEQYADPSRLRYWRYRFMEATGLSTF